MLLYKFGFWALKITDYSSGICVAHVSESNTCQQIIVYVGQLVQSVKSGYSVKTVAHTKA